jgi:Tol biopolymer transport system component/DNA-binding winged helix-turn-helix (wHTH) protein
MPEPSVSRRVRLGPFELDPRSGELSSNGSRQTLPEQPLALLKALLAHPGELVTRDELRRELWPEDTFVDFERGLNAAVKRLRDALGDSAERPAFIETIPRRGYRLVAAVDGLSTARWRANGPPAVSAGVTHVEDAGKPGRPPRGRAQWYAGGALLLALGATFAVASRRHPPESTVTRSDAVGVHPLKRLTFASGLDTDPTWSPDGRFIAYASDRAGNFDIWIQPVDGGEPWQLTRNPEADTQPTWSPDGSDTIVYRSERHGGGLFAVPARGGLERQLATFGTRPKWAPDGSRILFASDRLYGVGSPVSPKFYTISMDGGAARRVLESTNEPGLMSWGWHPDGRGVSILRFTPTGWDLVTDLLDGSSRVEATGLKTNCQCPFWAAEVGVFDWAPSGDAVFVGCTHELMMDVWRFPLDRRQTVRTPEAVTNGTNQATSIAVSPNSARLAFTQRTMRVREWAFPFDAARGRITGAGKPITDANALTTLDALSTAGDKLLHVLWRPGSQRGELFVTDARSGESRLLGSDDQDRAFPVWAPDERRIAYVWSRTTPQSTETALVISQSDGSAAHPLVAPRVVRGGRPFLAIFDWSRGRLIGTSDVGPEKGMTYGLTEWLTDGPSEAVGRTPRIVAADSRYHLWQGHLSPNGRWIAFVAQRIAGEQEAIVEIVPEDAANTTERDWTPVAGRGSWADKPRWSPDGRMLYFVELAARFFDLWGVPVDPASGKPSGPPFRITRFDTPEMQISPDIGSAEIGVSAHLLTLTMMERTGNIWIADNVDR